MPVVHYPPVIGGFEVFLQNIAERIGMQTPFIVLTGKVKRAEQIEKKGKLLIDRSASLWNLSDISGSSYVYIFTSLPILFFKSIQIIRKERINVLHANGFFNGIVCFLLKKVTNVPYVMTIQSADFTIYHPGGLYKLIASIQASVERAIYRNASICHSVSNDLCEHYRKQGVEECVMIPNGVETDLFYALSEAERKGVREKYEIPNDAHVIVNVSRLEHKNGVGDVIDACGHLFKKMDNAALVIVGDGSLRRDLERRAREIGIRDRVYFLGEMDRSEVGRIISSSDVFVRTPLSEGFGISFLEAMAAEVPVVATPVGGIPDFLEDGETGLFAEVGNVTDIREKVEELIGNELLREKLKKQAKGMVEEKYDWNMIAKGIYDLYRKAARNT